MSKLCVACIFTTPLWILAGMHWAVMLECKDCYLCNPSKQTVPFPTTDIVEWTLLSITICNCSVLVVSVVTELGLVLVMQNFLYALLLSTFAVNFVWLFCISGKKGNFWKRWPSFLLARVFGNERLTCGSLCLTPFSMIKPICRPVFCYDKSFRDTSG